MTAAVTQKASGRMEFAALDGVPVWWESKDQQVNRLSVDATIEQWVEQAGMNWTANGKPVRYMDDQGAMRVLEGQQVLYRSDNGNGLGVVGDRFKVVQPRQTIEFFRDMIETLGFKMKTAGTLHGGRKFWAQAEIGAETITKGTLNKGSLLFATAVDGTMANIVKNVNTEVVCANTMAVALGEKGSSIVRISHRSVFDADAVKRQLGVSVDNYARFIKQARELARMDLSPAQADQFVFHLMGGKVDMAPTAADKVKDSHGYRTILALFAGTGRGMMLPGRYKTAWGLVNAVTEYVDHHQRSRSEDNRFESAMFGAGDELKSRAWNAAAAAAALV